MHPLVNMVFLSFGTRRIGSTEYRLVEYQGQVEDVMGPDIFLVQLYGWIMGEPGPFKVVRADEMADWQFFEDWDDLDWAYKYNGHAAAAEEYAKDKLTDERARALPASTSTAVMQVPAAAPRSEMPLGAERTLKEKLRERRDP